MSEHVRYRRVANDIREQIRDGSLKPDQALPSITVLCHQTGYSRRTITRAMRVLEREGLIERVPGIGYFVYD